MKSSVPPRTAAISKAASGRARPSEVEALRAALHSLQEVQTAIGEISQLVAGSRTDVKPVLDSVVEHALRLCGARFADIFLTDGKTIWLRSHNFVADSSIEAEANAMLSAYPRPLDRGSLPGRVILDGQIVEFPDVETDPNVTELTRRHARVLGYRSGIMVPMMMRAADVTEIIGVIGVARGQAGEFPKPLVRLLQTFADQAAIAVENARLMTETRQALDQQTATAEILQVINSSPGDLAPVFDALLERGLRLCGGSYGSLLRYDDELFHVTAAMHADGGVAERHPRRPPFRPEAGDLLYPILEGEDVAVVNDVQDRAGDTTTPVFRAVEEAGRYHSILGVALRKERDLLGAIAIWRREVRSFSDKEIALLQNFAQQAVIAMENARLLGELRQRTEEVAELNRGLEARVAEAVEELGRVARLKRFLAPQIAELIVSQGDEKILESHRREIVVVFCDLRGYTAFTETAEPEEVLDFLRAYHGALGSLVAQFEGTLDQFSGDGIMVFFNDPVPIADPADRAVNMAVAMREAAGTLIADWRERGRGLGFGVGIAQGYATLGQIGFSERSGYTAIGTVCNLAARLCAEAKDGQILLSQRVNVALRGQVAIEQIGTLTLKGFSQPVVAFNVPPAVGQPAFRVIEGGSPSI